VLSLEATTVKFAECTDLSYTEPRDYLDDAYHEALGQSRSSISTERITDLILPTAGLCALAPVNTTVTQHSIAIGRRLNPATDNIIKALSYNLETSDLKVRKIINLKYANSIYSFYDDTYTSYSNGSSGGGPSGAGPSQQNGGCVPLDFSQQADRNTYMALVTRFESSGNYGAYNRTSRAYGRYQFIPSTGAQYCAEVGNNCCAHWHSTTQQGKDCQDAMYLRFTQANVVSLNRRNFSINTCSVYLSHQLGVGGYNWLRGGRRPSRWTFEILRDDVIAPNLHGSYRTRALTATTEQQLRDLFRAYWSSPVKFNGDIFTEVGQSASLSGLTSASNSFNSLVTSKVWHREGILLELKKIIRELELIYEESSLKNQKKMLQ
jgi:hypothetical protein